MAGGVANVADLHILRHSFALGRLVVPVLATIVTANKFKIIDKFGLLKGWQKNAGMPTLCA
jgi:hypothetical protein